MVWCHFMDMHSGGRLKQKPYQHIFIELPERDATAVFYHRFGHNPNDVACSCCGENYSITEYESLAEATDYERRATLNGPLVLTVNEYGQREDVLYIPRKEIDVKEETRYHPGPGYDPQDDDY